jgi:hypothetical protein
MLDAASLSTRVNFICLLYDRSHPQTQDIYAKLREMGEKLKLEGHDPDANQVLLNSDGEK